MNIAYVISESFSIASINGIVMQAKLWGEELKRQGHKVVYVNPWEEHDWTSYDIVHIFGACEFLYNFVSALSEINRNIVFSPIIDTIQSVFKYKIAANLGCVPLRLSTQNFMIKRSFPYIKKVFVRSKYEYRYVNEAYSVPSEKISVIPLSYRLKPCSRYPQKENVCFHLSRLTDERKNVLRLLQAAQKYKFKLILAGTVSSEKTFEPFKKIIDENENITYLGRIPDSDVVKNYLRAKVFALPSINEGVGMVALDAALYGCDIVVTEIGGPSEYYDNKAIKVNPYSVDAIGKSILTALSRTDAQPSLMNYINQNYSLERCVAKLTNAYNEVN